MGTILSTQTAAIHERMGRFQGILQPGFNFMLLKPLLLDAKKNVYWHYSSMRGAGSSFSGTDIPLSDLCYDPPALGAVTKNGVEVKIDIVVYYAINDVQKAVYNVQNLYGAVEHKVSTALYAAVRRLDLEDLTSEAIERGMDIASITEHAEQWGVIIKSVNVESIALPKNIQEATTRTIAQKRTAEVELIKLEQEAKRKTKMACVQLEEQRAQHIRKAEEAEFNREQTRKAREAEMAAKRQQADARAYAELTMAKNEAEAEKLRAAARTNALVEEGKVLKANPEMLELLKAREQSRVWEQMSRHGGTRLILGSPEVLQQTGSVPIVQQLAVQGPSSSSSSAKK